MDTILSAAATISLIDENGSVIKTWRLEGKKTFRIGRAKSNEITLAYTWVSRQHAMLQVEENGTFNAMDMGSSNGTFVNGRRIYTPTPLRSGDLIQIGNKTKLTFLHNYTAPSKVKTSDEDDEKTVAFMAKQHVTILLCDIRNFTSLSEEIGDQKISDILKKWTMKTNETVSKFCGNVDKFIGDAVMAIWAGSGTPSHNVHMALRCALEISELTGQIGDITEGLPAPLTIGAAINTGEAVMGNIGVDGNRDYTVIGDVVNVAFRLESLTDKIGKDLLLGQESAAFMDESLLGSFFKTCKYLVKGKKVPVTAYGCDFGDLKKYLQKTR